MSESDDGFHSRLGKRSERSRERDEYWTRARRRQRSGSRSSRSALKRSLARRSYYSYYDDNGAKRRRVDSASDSCKLEVHSSPSEESQAPTLMTFREYLLSQKKHTTDEDAVLKYGEYKIEFMRAELRRFFCAHKEEEWFRSKYHPDERGKQKEKRRKNLLLRLKIFEEMVSNGIINRVHADFAYAAKIIWAMDSFVVKLEGGSDDDLAALQEERIDDEGAFQLKDTNGPRKAKTINCKESILPKNSDGCDSAVSDSDSEKSENFSAGDERNRARKRILHKTSSIFLHSVPPNISIEEIEKVCKLHPGFLRVGLSDPVPEQKFCRRGWVTFRKSVNIKDICWSLSSVRIGKYGLDPVVNRDLTKRILCVSGISGHKQIAQNDLRLAARLAAALDRKASFYQPINYVNMGKQVKVDPVAESNNPLLQNLADYVVEETSAEEEELLGITLKNPADASDHKVAFVRDNAVLKKLDHIIFYLRFVYSVDFYGHGEYPNEDSMPNRCGIMHVRDAAPITWNCGADEEGRPLITQKSVDEYIAKFNESMQSLLIDGRNLTEKELEILGKKDPEKEVEAFIDANTVELERDKWLCPLSGKKFKGPEFIRKHLTRRYSEKLEEVRKDAIFFNNYLADPRRLQNPEMKFLDGGSGFDRDQGRTGRDPYSELKKNHGGGETWYTGTCGSRNCDRGRRDPRKPVSYRDINYIDLDDPENFI